MPSEYVEQRNGGYYVQGTRVSLDSIVYAFLCGESPEGIAESFPALSLEQVYGAITFYLANRESIDPIWNKGRLSSPACATKPGGSILNFTLSWMRPGNLLSARPDAAAFSAGRRP